jgi:hypothetical protein
VLVAQNAAGSALRRPRLATPDGVLANDLGHWVVRGCVRCEEVEDSNA